jgi:hypothetical protein
MLAIYATHPRSRVRHLADHDPISTRRVPRTYCGLRITDEWQLGQVTYEGGNATCGRCRENSLTKPPRF